MRTNSLTLLLPLFPRKFVRDKRFHFVWKLGRFLKKGCARCIRCLLFFHSTISKIARGDLSREIPVGFGHSSPISSWLVGWKLSLLTQGAQPTDPTVTGRWIRACVYVVRGEQRRRHRRTAATHDDGEPSIHSLTRSLGLFGRYIPVRLEQLSLTPLHRCRTERG